MAVIPPDPSSVAPPLDASVATNIFDSTGFLYTGPNPIQSGVAPGTIQPRRAAVLRGRVLDAAKSALPGALIGILGHPEFGQTLSRADGRFDLAVNGGSLLAITYSLNGYLPAQRQVSVPWQNFTQVPDVVLLTSDPNVTVVDTSGSDPNLQVARGSVSNDSSGTRQATLLIPPNTTAWLVQANGSTQVISTLHLRATEYTVGANNTQAMPANLPPSTGYTYAVAFTADEVAQNGASGLRFSQTLPEYTENFLGLSVGQLVPVGYYSASLGQWIPGPNGIVVRILSIANGQAALDLDGRGQPATPTELSSWGISASELQLLATLNQVGQTLWRVPYGSPASVATTAAPVSSVVGRLSAPPSASDPTTPNDNLPADYNLGIGPPPGALPPGQPPPKPGATPPPDPCHTAGGSTIDCQTRAFGEDVSIVGTGLTLHYQSDRQPGNTAADSVTIPLSGAALPPDILRVDLNVQAAGESFSYSFAPAANLSYTFTWDGKNAYGQTVQGAQAITAQIGYANAATYLTPPQISSAADQASVFGHYSFDGAPATTNADRTEVELWQNWQGTIGSWRAAAATGLGGWDLDVHHAYDPIALVLYKGDGSQESVTSIPNQISDLAGVNGVAGCAGGDGIPATQAQLYVFNGGSAVAIAADGTSYVADWGCAAIKAIAPNGTITTVAGNGYQMDTGDGGPASQANLYFPRSVALGPDGSLYIGEEGGRVRKVDLHGTITTVAGTGQLGYSGDGGPATQARFSDVRDIAVGADGSLYIANDDRGGWGWRIREVDPSGVISTVNVPGLGSPVGLAVGPDGSLYIADNDVIRKLAPSGTASIVAGGGPVGFAGDGGPATQAGMYSPADIAVRADGALYISDSGNARLRLVDPKGIITTVAGNGTCSSFSCSSSVESGSGGPAQQAVLYPGSVAIAPNGNVVVSDGLTRTIRQIGPALPGPANDTWLLPSTDGGEIYELDANGRHLATLDPLNGTPRLTFGYDSQNRLATVTDNNGNVTAIQRDASGSPTKIVAPFGQTTTLALDANGYLASISDPLGNTYHVTSTSVGLILAFQDPNGNTAQHTFDPTGRLIQDQDASGSTTTLASSATTSGYTTTLTSAVGRVETYSVDTLTTGGTSETYVDPSGLQSSEQISASGGSSSSDATGQTHTSMQGADPRFGVQVAIPISVTAQLPSGLTYQGGTTRVATLSEPTNLLSLSSQSDTTVINGQTYTDIYDDSNRAITTTTPLGRQIVTGLDAQGRPIQIQIGNVLPIGFSYDSHGRVSTLSQGTGIDARTNTLTYASDGVLQAISNPLGQMTTFLHDASGRLTGESRPDGSTVGFGFDPNANLTSLTPPGRNAHAFSYNAVNQITGYTPPSLGNGSTTTQYTYDTDHNLIQATIPDGRTIKVEYDNGGRWSATRIARGQISSSYDPATGNISSLNAPGGLITSFTYDGTMLTGEIVSGPVSGSVTRAYNSSFDLASETVAGNAINYDYDNDLLMTGAGSESLTRDPSTGLLTATALAIITETISYNGFGEPSQSTASAGGLVFYSVQYSYDGLGRIVTRAEAINGTTTTYDYQYDGTGRLIQVTTDGNVTAAYVYDGNGNRLSVTNDSGTISGTYDAQDELTSYGNTTYFYDAQGTLAAKITSGQTTSYSYDELGNLLEVSLPNGTTIGYLVDGMGRRLARLVNGTVVAEYLYDGQHLVAQLDGSGSLVSRFVYASRATAPDYLIQGGTTYRIIADQLGSPRLVVNASTGAIVEQRSYDEFGNLTHDSNPGFLPFGFAGGLDERDTGLVRLGARDYDPATGRWTAKDPVFFSGGSTNLYAYVENDPANQIDPTGQDALSWMADQLGSMGSWIGKGLPRSLIPDPNILKDEPAQDLILKNGPRMMMDLLDKLNPITQQIHDLQTKKNKNNYCLSKAEQKKLDNLLEKAKLLRNEVRLLRDSYNWAQNGSFFGPWFKGNENLNLPSWAFQGRE